MNDVGSERRVEGCATEDEGNGGIFERGGTRGEESRIGCGVGGFPVRGRVRMRGGGGRGGWFFEFRVEEE